MDGKPVYVTLNCRLLKCHSIEHVRRESVKQTVFSAYAKRIDRAECEKENMRLSN